MKKPSINIQLLTALWFVLITFALYGPSINHGYNIDDNYVIEDKEIAQQGIKGIPAIFSSRYHNERDQQFGYRPLTIALYAIEYQLFGENTSIFHLMNLLWYAALMFVLFLLFRKLFSQVSLWFILIALTIYAIHPLHSEVVLSLKNREEILCLFLSVLSWIQFIKYYDTRKWQTGIAGILLLGLAFLAKETAVIFVVIIPLSLWFFRSREVFNPSGNVTRKQMKTTKETVRTHVFIAILQLVVSVCIYTVPDLLKPLVSTGFSTSIQIIIFILIGLWLLRKNKTKPMIKIKHPAMIMALVFFLFSFAVSFIHPKAGEYFLPFFLLFFAIYTHHQPLQRETHRIKQLKIPKRVWFLIGLGILSGIVLFIIYIIPKMSLPEQNAPVYKWQNPLFMDKTVTTKIGVVFYSLAWYLKLLFLPFPLRFYYGYALVPAAGIFNPVVIVSILVHLALLYIIFKGFKKRTIWSFAIAVYLIAIIPFSNIFFPLTGIIAERLLFIPSLGFAIGITWLIFHVLKQRTDIEKPQNRSGIIALSILIILPFSIISMKRTPDWKNRNTLYEADISKLENSAKANNLYANYLVSQIYAGIKAKVPLQRMNKVIQEAIDHFQQAIEIDSTYANPYHNLGYVYLIVGRDYETAETYFTKSIMYDSTIYESWLNRGVARFYQNKLDEAEQDLWYCKEHGFRKDKDKVFYYLGRVNEYKQDTAKAIVMYDSVLTYNPGQTKSIENIMRLYANQKKYEKALKYSNILVKNANPQNDKVWVDKGNYHLLSGDTVQAIKAWEKAFNIYPGNYNIAMTLANYYDNQGMHQKGNAIRSKANSFRRQHQGQQER
ncbi:MAG: tetratricopeptide repeat protein [Bacteroidales bacterium]